MPYVNKPRPYKKEYKQQKARGERLARNARERARYEAKNKGKDGKITDVKGEDIDHKKPLSKGGTNKPSNLRSVSPSTNDLFLSFQPIVAYRLVIVRICLSSSI